MANRTNRILRTRLAAATVLAAVVLALGQPAPAADSAAEIINQKPTESLPDAMQGVGITEHLDAALPADLSFVDSEGRPVTLGQICDGRRPVLLTLNYSNCPMLCSVQLNSLWGELAKMPWDLGNQYQMITVSIDPLESSERAALTKQKYLRAYGRAGTAAGWHVLTGREENIHKLADTVGFGYRYDAVNKQFAHAAVVMVLTPEGRVSRYLYGVQYDPQTLRFSLLEAAAGKVGSTAERVLLYCYQYDGTAGRYAPAARNIMKAGGALTILLLGGLLTMLWMRDRRRTRLAAGGTP